MSDATVAAPPKSDTAPQFFDQEIEDTELVEETPETSEQSPAPGVDGPYPWRMARSPGSNEITPKGHPTRRIAVVGYTGSRGSAPHGDPEWELWGLNDAYKLPDIDPAKFDRWFDLHPQTDIRQDTAHVEWLSGLSSLPVYVHEPQPDMPTSLRYPRTEISGAFSTRYFTNSISYMIALAITELSWALEEWKQSGDPAHRPMLGVYGVDMATDSEYGAQRPSCEYFLGIAAGAGFEISIADTSDLLQVAEMYGETDGALNRKLTARQKELEERMNELRQQEAQLRSNLDQCVGAINATSGALDNTRYIRSVWTVPEVDRAAASKPGQLDLRDSTR